ncbi:uncharacterized protein BO97DRAFT_422334 [Aspergillus homomorphus CBS 101889]|uniref:Uncharacterized protein n=1 Tax=Aspergillus homomorphus (strain CBS 101889) TaxID=1450537 RepID=A0A395I459_ASPHC|nr:hypothetical protein BO97DRAFT_422334 [Aspergillus homomorphus CBS 101889]RAL14991.1 hypothetical protein BO97DRAFT_422334 [Aspergillus homomorphus CBS 101889]
MSDHICPSYTVLKSEDLNYDDLTKLNPFYEPFIQFWSSSPTSYAASPLDAQSTSSSEYIPVGIDSDLSPLDSPSSPVMHGPQFDDTIQLLKKPGMTLHDGRGHEVCYHPYSVHDAGQTATVEPSLTRQLSSTATDLTGASLIGNPLSETKSAHKKLFGEKGWLGSNADLRELAGNNHKSLGLRRLGKKFKMHVEDLMEDLTGDLFKANPSTHLPGPLHERLGAARTVPISLDAPTQAKLYSQMEVMICVAANRFLIEQYHRGLLSDESITKITNFWDAKNRPRVVEFHYDQATQRQLILLNLCTVQFSGPSATNPVQLRTNLNNWKAIGKEMSVRTFCTPDSAIRKHMNEVHRLLEMLGASRDAMHDFASVRLQALLFMKRG